MNTHKASVLALLANASYSWPVVVNPMTEFSSSIQQRRTSALWRYFFVRNALGAPFMGGPGGEPHGSPVSFVAGLLTRPVPPTRLAAGAEFKTANKETIMANSVTPASKSTYTTEEYRSSQISIIDAADMGLNFVDHLKTILTAIRKQADHSEGENLLVVCSEILRLSRLGLYVADEAHDLIFGYKEDAEAVIDALKDGAQ